MNTLLGETIGEPVVVRLRGCFLERQIVIVTGRRLYIRHA